MCNLSEWIVREALLAYDRGDVAAMMDFVDPCLEWDCLDPGPGRPAAADPPWPQTGLTDIPGSAVRPAGGDGIFQGSSPPRRGQPDSFGTRELSVSYGCDVGAPVG